MAKATHKITCKDQETVQCGRYRKQSGKLKYYTDLSVKTGSQTMTLQFFLTDLWEHKAILGYSWFAAVQPNIDWKTGWINHTQLLVILHAPNVKKATFVP